MTRIMQITQVTEKFAQAAKRFMHGNTNYLLLRQ